MNEFVAFSKYYNLIAAFQIITFDLEKAIALLIDE